MNIIHRSSKMAGRDPIRRAAVRASGHRPWYRPLSAVTTATLLAALGISIAGVPGAETTGIVPSAFEIQSLDGSGNNTANPDWGRAGTVEPRIAPARYADGHSALVSGPNPRYISNRIMNDVSQNIFSERAVSHWGTAWGQFIDHTIGFAQVGTESLDIPFDSADPLESFTNDLGSIAFTRDVPAPGTGVTNARQQINAVSSYIDAQTVYGLTDSRLEWLRVGPVDGDLNNNGAELMLQPDGELPRRTARGDAATAPEMMNGSRLLNDPGALAVAGDVRANNNIELLAAQTLMAREHNRIVSLLPSSLTEEQKFQIARRAVIAEQQYVTYNEFLPVMGVSLPAYTGYNPNLDASELDEFSTVAYRMHSQLHGEVPISLDASRYTAAQLAAIEAQGIELTQNNGRVSGDIPLNVGFFNPDLIDLIGLGPLLQGIGSESEYHNDELVDNQMRSVLFQVPVSGNPACLDGPDLPQCFDTVSDISSINVQRGRDHGMPSYNQLRQALGLAPRTSFTEITGESTESFPSSPLLTPGNEINDPASLDFTALYDIDGQSIPLDSPEAQTDAVRGVRLTTLAARLKAIYGSVDDVDAWIGMNSEPHAYGHELGELQTALWTRMFQTLRDGDRFFFGNDPGLTMIQQQYGIDYRHTLAQIIAANTDVALSDLSDDVFLVPSDDLPAVPCQVRYTVNSEWPGGFNTLVTISNAGTTPIDGWTLRWQLPSGQRITSLWNGQPTQTGADVTVSNQSYNATIGAGGGSVNFGFNASWDDATNARPPTFALNGARCAVQ